MLKIRQFKPSDREELRKICVETTLFPKTKKVRQWLPIAYNDYYTERQSEFVFVLADEADRAAGYILCAPDETEFRKTMAEEYLPQIKKISLLAYLMLKNSLKKLDRFYGGYPAHLHIDIAEKYRHMGMGTKLMDYLFAKLREKNIKGVKLGCAAKNKKAVAFYTKYGFSVLEKQGGEIIFGKKAE